MPANISDKRFCFHNKNLGAPQNEASETTGSLNHANTSAGRFYCPYSRRSKLENPLPKKGNSAHRWKKGLAVAVPGKEAPWLGTEHLDGDNGSWTPTPPGSPGGEQAPALKWRCARRRTRWGRQIPGLRSWEAPDTGTSPEPDTPAGTACPTASHR